MAKKVNKAERKEEAQFQQLQSLEVSMLNKDKFTDDELDIQNIKKEEDPLWDEPKPSLLGCAYYKLEPVAVTIPEC